MGSKINEIVAKEIFSTRGHVTLEVIVLTEDGSRGTHNPSTGISMGKYEAAFLLDGGDRWFGRGVLKAVNNVNTVIAPALKGMDVTGQRAIDDMMIRLDGTPNKSKLGANTIVCVSIAVLKAAAASSRLPLYRYIGGVNACTLPCPRIGFGIAGTYRDPGETRLLKPSFELAAFGAKSFSEAVHMSERIRKELGQIMQKKYGFQRGGNVLAVVKDDKDALAAMTEAIENAGYKNKVGIVVDCAAGCFYESDTDKYVGLFSKNDKTKEDMLELYKRFVKDYPIVALEDPLHEDEFEGHALLTKELGIEIVGDDLFTTNPKRVQKGVEMGAANAMVLKIPQVGTVSEALEAVHLAQRNGWEVDPCGSRGDPSADLAVGLNCGDARADLNRLLSIEEALGSSAKFLGGASYKTRRPLVA